MFEGFEHAFRAFEQAGVEDPLLETLRLLDVLSAGAIRKAAAAGLSQAELQSLAATRKEGVPLEYILGKAVFMDLQLDCAPGALIPREETELLVRTALHLIAARQAAAGSEPVGLDAASRLTVLDMGTGSGNIAVALAMHAPDVCVLASDVSEDAVAIACRQVAKFHLEDRVTVFHGDLYEPLLAAGWQGKVDIIACNPPYLPTSTLAKLAKEIADHEPRVAFDAGPYGINVFRRLITGAVDLLTPDGILVFEIGAGQEKLVTRLLEGSGQYANIEHHRDAAGQVRVISAQHIGGG
jgi:release factor glutamine methyltransferase